MNRNREHPDKFHLEVSESAVPSKLNPLQEGRKFVTLEITRGIDV